MPVINGEIQIKHGLFADLPDTGLLGEFFFCIDTGQLFAWNGTAMVSVGGDEPIPESDVINLVSDLAGKASTGSVAAAIATEISARNTAIGVETTRAEAAEALLASTISVVTDVTVETTRAEAAEAVLTTAVSTETAARIAGDATTLASAKTYADADTATEVTRAEAAEALLAPKASPTFTGTPTFPAGSIAIAALSVDAVTIFGDGVLLQGTVTEVLGGPTKLSTILVTQTANTVMAGPSSGSAHTPTFRSLVSADIPSLSSLYDAAGSAATAQSTAETFATSAIATEVTNRNTAIAVETTRAEAAEALLAPLASPTFTGTVVLPSGQALIAPVLGTPASGTLTNCTGLPYAALTGTPAIPTSFAWNVEGNATGNLTLANAAYTSTFNQTSAAAWLWANTTAGTSGTTNASPLLELAANYWTGSASATDLWTISSQLSAGTNGASILNFYHTGSTGTNELVFGGASDNPITLNLSSGYVLAQQFAAGNSLGLGSNGLYYGATSVWTDATVYSMGVVGASHYMGIGSSSVLRFSSTTAYSGAASAGLSLSSGALSVGNGLVTDWSGILKASGLLGSSVVLNQLASVGTVTVTPTGGSASTWTYVVVAKDANGYVTAASTAFSTTTGAATLTGAAYNTLTWVAIPGAASYDVYRTVCATSPVTIGKIGNVLSSVNVATTGFVDTGLAGDTTVAPSINTTGTISSVNPTVATISTTNASPIDAMVANYWTGSASAPDTWTFQSSLAAGTNGASTLAITHSGSTGAALVSLPTMRTAAGTNAACAVQIVSVNTGFYSAGGGSVACASGSTGVWQSINGAPSNCLMIPTTGSVVLGFAPNFTGYCDVGFSRSAVGLVNIGNGWYGSPAGALALTGEKNYGGIQILQAPTVVGTVTVTPTGGSATAYSYEVVALDVNLQPIGTNAAGSTTTGVATLTTSAFNTVAWTAIQGAYAYAVYRSASSGTPSTTGLLYGSTTLTSVAVQTAQTSGLYSYASTPINAKLLGQLVTVQGCANPANNGTFYCLSSGATSCVLMNPYAVAEASSPASAALTSGMVPAENLIGTLALSFVDYGWSANSVAAPTVNAHGSLGFVSTYESSATGPAYSQDLWTVSSNIATGVNGVSTLNISHPSGSTGIPTVAVPNLTLPSSSGKITMNGGSIDFGSGSGTNTLGSFGGGGTNSVLFHPNGVNAVTIGYNGTTSAIEMVSTYLLGWSATVPYGQPLDTALSRTAAATVALGNGTAGDASGTLKAASVFSGNYFTNVATGLYKWYGGSTNDTGLSRLAAGSLAVGNGTNGDTSGQLTATTITVAASSAAPTSAGTPGTAGQIIYYGGLAYLCSVTGAAGSATWNKLSMVAV
jgi:hypothetical protein